MTRQTALAKNPAKACSLLLRLVKKKDEHHERVDAAAADSSLSLFNFEERSGAHHFYQ